MAYQQHRGLGQLLCDVLAVTTPEGGAVERSLWLERVASFVDRKLGEAALEWYQQREVTPGVVVTNGRRSSLLDAKKSAFESQNEDNYGNPMSSKKT